MSNERREYDRNQPVALDDRDPGNSEIETMVGPLDADDDVFQLVQPQQGDVREAVPVGEETDGDQR